MNYTLFLLTHNITYDKDVIILTLRTRHMSQNKHITIKKKQGCHQHDLIPSADPFTKLQIRTEERNPEIVTRIKWQIVLNRDGGFVIGFFSTSCRKRCRLPIPALSWIPHILPQLFRCMQSHDYTFESREFFELIKFKLLFI